ncbi:GNAT family N-acetyltransferase [Candidatus Micrarchaeota archaeon]|nr:GNAT family N-acetyltransferase [Candidatus Micrarchaeota archaeon]
MFEILFLIGLIAFIGFVGRWVFVRTRIPEILILLAIGFALGPMGPFSSFSAFEINLQSFRSIAPVVGAVAIVSFVFDAGLHLKVGQILKSLSFSTLFAITNMALCICILAFLLHFLFAWDMAASLLLAVIFGGPSSFAIYSMLPFVRTSNHARGILYLEGTLSAILVSAMAITLLRYPYSEAGATPILPLVLSSFSVSFILGLAAGLVILWALFRFRIRKFGYLLTFSALLMLFFVDYELLGGIGVISIALIGLVIGNSGEVFRLMGISGRLDLEDTVKGFREEVSLFISTFFFVYLGMVARPDLLLEPGNVLLALTMIIVILLCRCLILLVANLIKVSQHNEDLLLAVMIPRDLLSATLATFVVLYPGFAGFSIEVVILPIALSSIISVLGTGYYERIFLQSFLFKRELTLGDGRKIAIRTIMRDDFPKLRKFLNELVKESALIAFDRYVNPIEESEMGRASLDKINRGDMLMWVGDYNGQIIARAVAQRMEMRERDNVCLSLYVAREFRGVHLGTTLLRMLIEESQKTFKPHRIYLSVYSNNEAAIHVYEKEHFRKVGVLPEWGKYEDTYLDEIYMVYDPKGAKGEAPKKKGRKSGS